MKRYFTALGVRCWVLGVGLYANAQQITNTNHPSPNTSVTTIVVTGDILLDRGVRKVIEKRESIICFQMASTPCSVRPR